MHVCWIRGVKASATFIGLYKKPIALILPIRVISVIYNLKCITSSVLNQLISAISINNMHVQVKPNRINPRLYIIIMYIIITFSCMFGRVFPSGF